MSNKNSKENNVKENSDKEKSTRQKNVLKNASIIAGGLAGVATATVLTTKAYEVSGRKKEFEVKEYLKKSLLDQAYEIIENSDIDRKIRDKKKEIELLVQQLDKKSSNEIKKKKQEDLCNRLSLQIQNKSSCLEYLIKQKEKQESISQNLSKRKALITEKENTSFLHPIKKSGIANEITMCEENIENDFSGYKSLKETISEYEKKEEVLTREYKKASAREKAVFFKCALAILGICLLCGIIVFIIN